MTATGGYTGSREYEPAGIVHPARDLGRWDWAYLVECETCGWYNLSQDYGWTKHSGVVHTEMLKIGHVLKSSEPERVERG